MPSIKVEMYSALILILVLSTIIFYMVTKRIGPVRALRSAQELARKPDIVCDDAWNDYAARLALKQDHYN